MKSLVAAFALVVLGGRSGGEALDGEGTVELVAPRCAILLVPHTGCGTGRRDVWRR